MKRTWPVLFGVLLLAARVVAQDQFNCTTNADNTIGIWGYVGQVGEVIIPSTITGLPVVDIEESAFAGNSILTNVTIEPGVTNIGSDAFNECLNLKSIALPNTLVLIGPGAFEACMNLTNAPILSGVTSIGGEAFGNCNELTNIVIPGSVRSIGEGAFEFCQGLTSVSINNGVTSIGQDAFFDCTNLASVAIPSSITNWGWDVFEACFNLTNVVMADSLTILGDGEFYECTNLTHVTLPSSLNSIAEGVFSDCTGLSNITIPTNVTSIEGYAFDACTSLGSLSIPAGVTNIGEAAFGGETSLTAIMVDALNPSYTSVNGVLFDKTQATLVQCPAGLAGSYDVPASVTRIGDNAFESCNVLTSITISSNVASIGIFAFYGCSSLVSITVDAQNPFYSSRDGVLFDKSQTTLLAYPPGLRGQYVVPDGVNNIASLGFYYCTKLSAVTIPASVTSIGESAFQNCSALTNLFFEGNAPVDGGLVFLFDPNPTVYYLPGTTGWGSQFSGDPTVLWNPQIQTSDGSFGVRSNKFGFNITWASGMVVTVEACTNLTNPVWAPLQSFTLTNGLFYFSEPLQSNSPGRYYRISSP
jgi:hypothetical protein